jgi:hypothetical protein
MFLCINFISTLCSGKECKHNLHLNPELQGNRLAVEIDMPRSKWVEHPNTRDSKVVSPWKQSLDGEQGQAPSWECFAKS